MSTTAREQRAEQADTARTLQTFGAINGGLEGFGIGLLFSAVAHHTWPAFRRKTVPFKVFVVCGFTLAGFAFGAEAALISYERSQRLYYNRMRRQAQVDLVGRGIMPTESAIQAWHNEQQTRSSEDA